MENRLKIGLFGIGLDVYWKQFEGLEERLTGYIDIVANWLNIMAGSFEGLQADIINLGMIDTPEKAFCAGHEFRKNDVDLIFLYVTTYALSSIVLPVVKRAGVPVIILNLSPERAIDYGSFNSIKDRTKMTAEWLAYCSACPLPEIANVFRRSNIKFFQVTGTLNNDADVRNEIEEWVSAAYVVNKMYHNKMGVMGTYYSGMMDIYTDLTLQCTTFGGHIEVIEVDELSLLRENVTIAAENKMLLKFEEVFEVQPDCEKEELRKAARTAVALELLVSKYNLGSIAYYYKGAGNPQNESTMMSIILGNSLLTAYGVPVAGEYEIKNAQAMKIMDIFGAGGSFSEYYAIDYDADVVLMGHDGPGHLAIAEGKIKVKPLPVYHGKNGSGLSVEMSVKYGDVTLLSVLETQDGKIKFLVAEAESVRGPILEIGNTNSRYKFNMGAKKFVEAWNEQGPSHHCAIGIGHIASKIKKLGVLLNIETTVIC